LRILPENDYKFQQYKRPVPAFAVRQIIRQQAGGVASFRIEE